MATHDKLTPEPTTHGAPLGQIPPWQLRDLVGGNAALGELYERCRRYLLLIANHEVGPHLRGKLGPSDIVQETLLRAQRKLAQFEGRTDAELRAWLRAILLNSIRDAVRQYQPGSKCDLLRERQLHSLLSDPGDARLPVSTDSPSKQLLARERAASLREALMQLPDDYRRVIQLRSFERRPFAEIGIAMGRSADASRKLWLRAVERLRDLLGADDESL